MELNCSSNPTPTSTKTPDSEIDTPPLIKPLSFSNGAFKQHHQYHHQQPPCAAVIYKECLKNHAASIGGHAVDGCGEFIASPDSNPSDPISLKCAACGCHRNFHRREPSDDSSSPTHFTSSHFIDFRHHIFPPIKRFSPSPSPSPSLSPPPLPSLSQPQPVTPTALITENPNGRKRFRTKFTQEQKEKMHSFSEKLGWKLQKCDEAAIDEFCHEIGVGKGVLRVWMHNNKNTFGKKEYQISNNNHNEFNINGTTSSNEAIHHHNNNDNSTTSNCGLHLHISTNGSSSSS
ncbi:zinc-finger homeodomain protein 9-like [Solanum dulcamara]|uniref:zinc-finger homeodomain protein 9-like n=1 Tax=Solanum dulcamara TaxID=45834 RepID=UPI0024869B22|nr:zinc-finger homeodomain protein 9-like [Solanum dulcamara]